MIFKYRSLLILLGVAFVAGPVQEGQAKQRDEPLLFTTSMHCMACHSRVTGPDGKDISIGWDWRATIMANSGRDPYWQASIRRETLDHPDLKAAIEDKCSTCHMPMQRFQAHAEGKKGQVFRYLDEIHSGAANVEPEARLEEAEDPKATLAADGVSCTLCHQVHADNFGQESSLDGGFLIDTSTAPEQRPLFGRYEMTGGRTRMMHSVTGFIPTQSDHLKSSELCATCHTLYTDAVDGNGKPAGRLPEQVPFQEWEHSDYRTTNTCQSCHMPVVSGEAAITSVHAQLHPNVPQHTFVGGNAFILAMLKDYAGELGVIAPPAQLQASIARTEKRLGTETAKVTIAQPHRSADRLSFDVQIANLAGHKLPTAYPARRVWLHVTVRNSKGAVVFESGAVRPDGSIVGNDNDDNPEKFEPHYQRITAPDEVQIYESIMGNYAEQPTTGLLYGTHYLKDDRLLPKGFDKTTADHQVAVIGAALHADRFVGGSDTVTYDVPLKGETGPFAVTVEAYYEAIGFRWAMNLRSYDAAEPKRFLRYYDEHATQSPKLLASATVAAN